MSPAEILEETEKKHGASEIHTFADFSLKDPNNHQKNLMIKQSSFLVSSKGSAEIISGRHYKD